MSVKLLKNEYNYIVVNEENSNSKSWKLFTPNTTLYRFLFNVYNLLSRGEIIKTK